MFIACSNDQLDTANYLITSAGIDVTILNHKKKTAEQCIKVSSPITKTFSSFMLTKSPSKRLVCCFVFVFLLQLKALRLVICRMFLLHYHHQDEASHLLFRTLLLN
jgi:hypothetical protein